MLDLEPSAALRNDLIAELSAVQSSDEAAVWAHRGLPAKNTLTSADARLVEAGFRAKLAAFDERRPEAAQGEAKQEPPGSWGEESGFTGEQPPPPAAEEADTEQTDAERPRLVGKTIRLRDKDHRLFVSRQPCLVCGRTPAEPHHLRFAQPRALGRKVSVFLAGMLRCAQTAASSGD